MTDSADKKSAKPKKSKAKSNQPLGRPPSLKVEDINLDNEYQRVADRISKATEDLTPQRAVAAQFLAWNGWRDGVKKSVRPGAVGAASRHTKIPISTLQLWLKEDEEFQEAIMTCAEEMRMMIIGKIMDGVKRGDKTFVIYAAKTLDPEMFDDNIIRLRIRQAHEEEMEKIRLQHAKELEIFKAELRKQVPEVALMPTFNLNVYETAEDQYFDEISAEEDGLENGNGKKF